MKEARRTAPQQDTEQDPAWQVVKRWPKIRGEPKIAWRFLWIRSNRGREQIAVKAVELGADQNTSDDAGNRYLDTLRGQGLVEIASLGNGVKLVTLLDPLDVAKARRACGGDSQALFAFLEDVEEAGTEYPPAVVRLDAAAVPVAEPRQPPCEDEASGVRRQASGVTAVPRAEPRSHRGSEGGTAERAYKDKDRVVDLYQTEDKRHSSALRRTEAQAPPSEPRSRRGSEGGTAERQGAGTAVASLGEALGGMAALANGSVYEGTVARTEARIRAASGWLADEDVLALATAFAETRVKEADLRPLLDRLASGVDAKGRKIDNPGGFFHRQVLFKFGDLGINPADYYRPRRPAPK